MESAEPQTNLNLQTGVRSGVVLPWAYRTDPTASTWTPQGAAELPLSSTPAFLHLPWVSGFDKVGTFNDAKVL